MIRSEMRTKRTDQPRRDKMLRQTRHSSETPGRLLTIADAAARAANSPAWWRKLASRRQIPVIKLGRSSRLREEDVNRIIAEGFRPAQPRG
jgi:hypothetical protein